MLPSLVKHPYVKLAAAADVREEAREKFKREFQAEVYDNAEDLCKSKNVDAVYIATPHQCHAEHVLMAAAHRKHAIVGEPMALDAGRKPQRSPRFLSTVREWSR